MIITDKCVVTIEYTLTDEDGEVLDSSADGGPLDYLHGAENIVPGLEKELTGKGIGDRIVLTLQPDDAYGPYEEDLVQTIPLSMFADAGGEVEPGMEFQAESPDGDVHIMTVVEVKGQNVVVDANHPLAGEVLHYDVTIKGIREATEEELDHGHPHGDGDCHH